MSTVPSERILQESDETRQFLYRELAAAGTQLMEAQETVGATNRFLEAFVLSGDPNTVRIRELDMAGSPCIVDVTAIKDGEGNGVGHMATSFKPKAQAVSAYRWITDRELDTNTRGPLWGATRLMAEPGQPGYNAAEWDEASLGAAAGFELGQRVARATADLLPKPQPETPSRPSRAARFVGKLGLRR